MDLLPKSVAKFQLISVQKNRLCVLLEMHTLLVCLLIIKDWFQFRTETASNGEVRRFLVLLDIDVLG